MDKITFAKAVKNVFDQSNVSSSEKRMTLFSLFQKINHKFKLRPISLIFTYSLPYPMIVFTLLCIRRAVTNPQFVDQPFLWASTFALPDPYYIVPTITCISYYLLFGQNISSYEESSLLFRIKRML